MNAPEMSPSNPHPPEDDAGELVSELDEMIAEKAAPIEDVAPTDDALTPAEGEAPEASPLDDIPNPEETLAGLDDMLAEAAEKAQATLSPLDEPEDVDPFSEIEDADDAESEIEDAGTEEHVAAEAETEVAPADAVEEAAPAEEAEDAAADADDPEASSIPESMDDGEVMDSATELAREMEESLHGEASEESLYDDDPDETDAPEIYGPGEAFEGAEPEAEAPAEVAEEPEAETEKSEPRADAGSPDADEQPPGAVVEAKPGKGSPVGKILGALAPVVKARGPLKGVSVSLANVLSMPLAKLSPEQRDLVGYAAVTLLFNALCLIVVLLFM